MRSLLRSAALAVALVLGCGGQAPDGGADAVTPASSGKPTRAPNFRRARPDMRVGRPQFRRRARTPTARRAQEGDVLVMGRAGVNSVVNGHYVLLEGVKYGGACAAAKKADNG